MPSRRRPWWWKIRATPLSSQTRYWLTRKSMSEVRANPDIEPKYEKDRERFVRRSRELEHVRKDTYSGAKVYKKLHPKLKWSEYMYHSSRIGRKMVARKILEKRIRVLAAKHALENLGLPQKEVARLSAPMREIIENVRVPDQYVGSFIEPYQRVHRHVNLRVFRRVFVQEVRAHLGFFRARVFVSRFIKFYKALTSGPHPRRQ